MLAKFRQGSVRNPVHRGGVPQKAPGPRNWFPLPGTHPIRTPGRKPPKIIKKGN